MESTVDNDIPTSVNDVETHIDKLSKFFYTDKCEDYLRDIIEVEEKILKGEINFSSKVQGLEDKDEILKYFKSIPVIDQIYDDEHLLHRCVELQKFVQGTKPDSEYKGIKTWFKYEGDVKSVTICGGTLIECDLFHLFAVLSEIDLMKNFISNYEDIEKIGEVSPLRWLMHVKIKMPVTFTNRDLICTGFGVMNKDHKNILITFKSVEKLINCQVPKETSKYKRIDCNFGYYHIQYIEENKYYITCGFNIDPKIPIIPWFILNNVLKNSTYYIMEGLKKQILCDKAKEVYKKRIEEKLDYYQHVKDCLSGMDK